MIDQLVVVPVKIRHDKRIRRTCKELGADSEPVGKSVGDDRVREPLAFQRRILNVLKLFPLFAKHWKPERSGIEERLLVERETLHEAVHHQRRAIIFKCHADSSVHRALLCFGPLSKNATVREVHPLTDWRKKRNGITERLIKINCELVHGN